MYILIYENHHIPESGSEVETFELENDLHRRANELLTNDSGVKEISIAGYIRDSLGLHTSPNS